MRAGYPDWDGTATRDGVTNAFEVYQRAGLRHCCSRRDDRSSTPAIGSSWSPTDRATIGSSPMTLLAMGSPTEPSFDRDRYSDRPYLPRRRCCGARQLGLRRRLLWVCRGWEPPAAHCRPGTGRSPGSQRSAFRGCRRTQNPPAYDANRRRDRISVVRRPALPPSRMCRYRSGAGRPHHNRGTRRLQGAIHLRAPRNHSKQNFHVRARLGRCRALRRVD